MSLSFRLLDLRGILKELTPELSLAEVAGGMAPWLLPGHVAGHGHCVQTTIPKRRGTEPGWQAVPGPREI